MPSSVSLFDMSFSFIMFELHLQRFCCQNKNKYIH